MHAGIHSALLASRGWIFVVAVTSLVCAAACGSPQNAPAPAASAASSAPAAGASPLDRQIQRFAPAAISADTSKLPENERQALAEVVEASKLMDGLFLDQVWAGNASTMVALAADRSPAGQAKLHYFVINKGPWSRLDENANFLGGSVPAKPDQANFYPAGATKADVQQWFNSLSGKAKDDATGFFSVIRRTPAGGFTAVPYSVEYRNVLTMAAAHLKKAASLTTQPTLKKYLDLRADAFLSNDYFASDMAWMELDASIEPTIGPYETYEDGWFGYKAAFEAFIAIKDDAETQKLSSFGAHLQELENALPIDPKYRNPKLGALAPIRVVNVVFSAGDGNRGVQTAAYNLPNDDRVIKEKGSKRVMLKNMQDAKFEKVLTPIAGIAIAPADRSKVSFDAFFTHILMHEVMHGLGPHQTTSGQPVRIAMKDQYSAIEEAKADISGLWALQQLADKGVISAAIAKDMYTTFLASAFRSVRFGLTEAHGKGIAMQLNYLLDHGAVTVNADGTFSVVDAKIKDAVAGLTHDLMTIEAEGNYDAAKDLLTKMGVVRPDVQKVLERLSSVPVDIEPSFVIGDR